MSKDEFILAVQDVIQFNCDDGKCTALDYQAAVVAIRAMLKCVEVQNESNR